MASSSNGRFPPNAPEQLGSDTLIHLIGNAKGLYKSSTYRSSILATVCRCDYIIRNSQHLLPRYLRTGTPSRVAAPTRESLQEAPVSDTKFDGSNKTDCCGLSDSLCSIRQKTRPVWTRISALPTACVARNRRPPIFVASLDHNGKMVRHVGVYTNENRSRTNRSTRFLGSKPSNGSILNKTKAILLSDTLLHRITNGRRLGRLLLSPVPHDAIEHPVGQIKPPRQYNGRR